MPAGALNWPGPGPESPHDSRYTPSGSNFWTRALPRSVTYTLPSPSTAADWGLTKWPGSRPDWPHVARCGWLVLPPAPAASGAAPHSARSAASAAAAASMGRGRRSGPGPRAGPSPPPLRAVQDFNAPCRGIRNTGGLSVFVDNLVNFIAHGDGGRPRPPAPRPPHHPSSPTHPPAPPPPAARPPARPPMPLPHSRAAAAHAPAAGARPPAWTGGWHPGGAARCGYSLSVPRMALTSSSPAWAEPWIECRTPPHAGSY